ncbi:hypothetical protein D3C72_2296910 [compost metagenome]
MLCKPSSTALTAGFAMSWPILSWNTEAFLATDVVSSRWPQASWKITPPKPLSMMTGKVPLGQGAAPSFTSA